ncbi:DNA helicase [uncultured Albimonas sp.]|uniref:DNA helicase n=1 Tax=uncultured Albimonas sp. TaxID=1331701 RepID=UPI0030ED5925|tara:strand:- start:202 stop:978 length:777 start_codon:yes stop_codon:yes gene_type:complete
MSQTVPGSRANLPALKRRARRLSRAEGIPLHAALDRLAQAEGFARWSLLAARAAGDAPGADAAGPLANAVPPPLDQAVFPRLSAGDRLLLAGRPGQGKTLIGLRLLLDAAREGRRATFYTLDWTQAETRARLHALAGPDAGLAEAPEIMACDDIDAERIEADLAAGPRGAVAAIDYLQLLDQRRSTPPLEAQVSALAAFARRSGAILAFLSQIDRAWRPESAPTPSLAHLRRPNPFPVEAFSHACFIHGGAMRFHDLP